EHTGVRLGHEWQQELPRGPCGLVGLVHADMASPDHRGAGILQGGDQAGRLRIVRDHHVAGAQSTGELLAGWPKGPLVRGQHRPVEWPAVTLLAMEAVVDPLRDREEVVVAVD